MKTIEKFDKYTLNNLSEIATKALNEALNEFGIKVEFAGGTFSSCESTQKFKYSLVDTDGKVKIAAEFLEWTNTIAMNHDVRYGSANFIGSKYKDSKNNIYTIKDFDNKKIKYPVIYTINDRSTTYKGPLDKFKSLTPIVDANLVPTLPLLTEFYIWLNVKDSDKLTGLQSTAFDRVNDYLNYDEDEDGVDKFVSSVDKFHERHKVRQFLPSDSKKLYGLIKKFNYAHAAKLVKKLTEEI